MQPPFQRLARLSATLTQNPYQAAIEATVVGISLGLIDIHSASDDWYDPISAYLVTGIALGLRHAGRAWQAWIPLGGSLYLIHRIAIASGYRPPYVEADAASALQTLVIAWPAGAGLVVGAVARFALAGLVQISQFAKAPPKEDRPDAGNREINPESSPDRVSSRQLAPVSADRLPTQPLTVRKLMVIVLLVGIHLAFVRSLLLHEPFFGFGTVYSQDYSESRFKSLRVGMSPEEVEAVVGQPLGKVPWNQDSAPLRQEMWFYSNGPNETANYERRWLLLENGKVLTVINDFWVD